MNTTFTHQSVIILIISVILLTNIAFAEDPVEFTDANLKIAVEESLNIIDPTPNDLLNLRWFDHHWEGMTGITSLIGLEYAKNLTTLNLYSCSIQDYSPLSDLHNLSSLHLDSCGISDLSSLVLEIERLPRLEYLSLVNNNIEDISSLVKMKNLESLWLSGNKISDISPLLSLRNLKDLGIQNNLLDDVISEGHLLTIRTNNPHIYIPIDFNYKQLIIPSILSFVLLFSGLFIIIRGWTEKGYIFEIIAGIAAAGLGCYLGLGAQILYTSGTEIPLFGNDYENPLWVGGVCGGIFGLLTGICFGRFLRKLLYGGHEAGGIVGKSILIGILLGVLCSTIVHINLMIAYRNIHFGPLLIGVCFGIGGGTVAGLIISVIFIVSHKIGLIKVKESA